MLYMLCISCSISLLCVRMSTDNTPTYPSTCTYHIISGGQKCQEYVLPVVCFLHPRYVIVKCSCDHIIKCELILKLSFIEMWKIKLGNKNKNKNKTG